MIIVAGKLMQKPRDFDRRFRAALQVISGGRAWLDWAIDTTHPFQVDTQAELITKIQEGLHGTGVAAIESIDLNVSVAKLMAMEPSDLDELVAIATGHAGSTAGKLPRILARYDLLTNGELDKGTDELGNHTAYSKNLRGYAPFQVLPIPDQRRLRSWALNLHKAGESVQPAIDFGVREAQDAEEFVNRFWFYVAAVRKDVAAEAKKLWDTIAEEAFPHLLTPSLGPDYSVENVARQIRMVAAQQPIGFVTVSSVASNIMLHTDYDGEKDPSLEKVMADYVKDANRFIAHSTPYSQQFAQDGLSQVVMFENTRQLAVVSVDHWGTIILREFCRSEDARFC